MARRMPEEDKKKKNVWGPTNQHYVRNILRWCSQRWQVVVARHICYIVKMMYVTFEPP